MGFQTASGYGGGGVTAFGAGSTTSFFVSTWMQPLRNVTSNIASRQAFKVLLLITVNATSFQIKLFPKVGVRNGV